VNRVQEAFAVVANWDMKTEKEISIRRRFETCADCPDYPTCNIISGFHGKSGFKYKKYKQSIEFIKDKGYAEFIKIASNWKGPYGRFD